MSAEIQVALPDPKGIKEFTFTLSRVLNSALEDMRKCEVEPSLMESYLRLILINSLLGFCVQNGAKPDVIVRIEKFFEGVVITDVEYYLEREMNRLLITILGS